MEPALVCLACGFPLGCYIDCFNNMKQELLKKQNDIHVDKKQFVVSNTNCMQLFEILHINKFCCRSQLLTNINMDSLLK